MRRSLGSWPHHAAYLIVILALLTGNVVGFAGGYVVRDRITRLLQPPRAVLALRGVRHHHGPHGLGGRLPTIRKKAQPHFGGTLPTAVDLSADAPPVGDQGAVNSCVSWSVGYALRGYYALRDGGYPAGGFAPLYLYSQVAGGQNVGTAFGPTFATMAQQGIDTAGDYTQGTQDYADPPTPAERTNAAPYKSAGYVSLFDGKAQGTPAQEVIEEALAAGNPVALGIPVYDDFYNANSTHYLVGSTAGTLYGYHAITAFKYDANGVWIENQWATDWGLGGWAELTWAFVNSQAFEADVLTMPAPAPTATPPLAPSATLTVAPATPSVVPATETVAPTGTEMPTVVPDATDTATATPVPSATIAPAPAQTWTVTHVMLLRSQPAVWAITPVLLKVGWKATMVNAGTATWAHVRLLDGRTGYAWRAYLKAS